MTTLAERWLLGPGGAKGAKVAKAARDRSQLSQGSQAPVAERGAAPVVPLDADGLPRAPCPGCGGGAFHAAPGGAWGCSSCSPASLPRAEALAGWRFCAVPVPRHGQPTAPSGPPEPPPIPSPTTPRRTSRHERRH